MIIIRSWVLAKTIFILSVLIVAGCTSTINLAPSKVVGEQLCTSGSWHNIVPGETNEREAIDILNSLSFLDQQSIREAVVIRDTGQDVKKVIWTQRSGIPARRTGSMLVKDGLVTSVKAPLQNNVDLAQIIENCGRPSFVKATIDGESPFVWFEFFYPTQGMVLIGRDERKNQAEVVLSPDARIIEAEYFSPTSLTNYLQDIRQILNSNTAQKIADEYLVWPGLGETIAVYPY